MLITCADCGCLVERDVITTPFDAYPDCGCAELSLRPSDVGISNAADKPS
jgi:hypothetical protein